MNKYRIVRRLNYSFWNKEPYFTYQVQQEDPDTREWYRVYDSGIIGSPVFDRQDKAEAYIEARKIQENSEKDSVTYINY